MTLPGTATAGTPFTFTVQALDAGNLPTTGYSGTVNFSSSDPHAGIALPASSTLTNGAGSFSATLLTAGSQSITATDSVSASINGSGTTVVGAGAAGSLAVTAPATASAGGAFNFTVTARDAFNNVATGYPGTVHFTSSDSSAVLPSDAVLGGGSGTFSATLKSAGSQTLTATDTITASITGSSGLVAVSAAAATHYSVAAPATATAGAAFNFSVTALDQFNNIASGYAGTVHFTSSDSSAVLPADSTLATGAGTFSATLATVGSQTVSATDTITSSITGSSPAITVSGGASTRLQVTAPSSATAGSPFSFSVTALDQFNNTATGYAGTVHFTSSDGQAVLPADSVLSGGTATFSATLKTSGSQTLTATDTVTSTITGTSGAVTVSATPATHYNVAAPASATAGSAFSFTVTALDAFNNTASGYAGTVHFTSSAGQAVLPANSTLSSGTGIFSATLNTGGSQTLTATDTVSSSITDTSSAIAVSAAAATHLAVAAPASATAGSALSFTVTALDQFNNTATGYAGTAHFTSSDGQAVLPANSSLSSGTGTFSATLGTAGSQTLTATDTLTLSITGTSAAIAVSAGAATHFAVTAPPTATAGTPVNFGVTALDASGNTATGYAGHILWTSTDLPLAVYLHAAYTGSLTNGTGTFSGAFDLAGTQTLTATDSTTASITGTTGPVAVSNGPATSLTVTTPSTATAGAAFSLTVSAFDQYGNPALDYAGTVHFSSTDGGASLPADSALVSGTGTFSATLVSAGTQTVTASDTITPSITGTSAAIAVGPAAANHFVVTAPASATAGSAFSFVVTALDAFNNTDTGYAGTVHMSSSDGAAALPADTTLTNGAGSFSATLGTVGSQTLTAVDTLSVTITGTSAAITVSAGPATQFAVSAPGSASAGVAFTFTVTALDQYNNVDTSYGGSVHFASTDPSASLPADSTLTSGAGSFSATFNTFGSQTLTASDSVNTAVTGSAVVSVPVPLAVTTSSLPDTTLGAAYAPRLFATGGTQPYTWTVSGLPPYLTVDATTGEISGTVVPPPPGPPVIVEGPPPTSAQYPVSVTVTDALSASAGATFTLTVDNGVAAAPSIPDLEVGVPVSVQILGGGSGTYSLSASGVPAGLSLGSDGFLTGTPTTASSCSFSCPGELVTMSGTDGNGAIFNSLTTSFFIDDPVALGAISPQPGIVGAAMTDSSPQYAVTGGVPPFTWTASGLPPGLTIDSSGGFISGTPTSAGSYTPTITVTDAWGQSASATTASLDIGSTPVSGITPGAGALAQAVADGSTVYNQALTAVGGVAPYSWSISGGFLPSGVALQPSSTSTTNINGIAASVGTSYFTVTVTDGHGDSASAPYSIVVAGAVQFCTSTECPWTFSPDHLPDITVGTPINQTVQLSSGSPSGTVFWGLGGTSTLPAWLTLTDNLNGTATLSGTPGPADAGNVAFTLQANDFATTADLYYSFTVDGGPVFSTLSPLSDGTVGVYYYSTLDVTGGVGPYTFSGATPAGLLLQSQSDGATNLSGVPTAVQTAATSTFTVTDALGLSSSTPFSLTVAPSTLAVGSTAISPGVWGKSYTDYVYANGDSLPLTWSDGTGLPAGLYLDSSGQVYGTPTGTGLASGTFTATVTDSIGNTASASVAWMFDDLAITTATVAPGDVGTPYFQDFAVSGGSGPYTFTFETLTGCTLDCYPYGPPPPGLAADATTPSALSGTPTAAGDYTLIVNVSDANGISTQMSYYLPIGPGGLAIATATLPDNEVGGAYDVTLTGTGGVAPYSWTLSTGVTGLYLDSSTGNLTGVPGVACAPCSIQVTLTDGAGETATTTFNPTIGPALALGGSFAPGVHGTPYSSSAAVSGGSGSLTYSVSGGQLPPGLALDPSTGIVSGTPAAGNYLFYLQATDTAGGSATQAYTINVS